MKQSIQSLIDYIKEEGRDTIKVVYVDENEKTFHNGALLVCDRNMLAEISKNKENTRILKESDDESFLIVFKNEPFKGEKDV